MAGEPSRYPWWAKPTGGNRGWALVLAVVYTLLFVVDAVTWLTRSNWFSGILALGFLFLTVCAWAAVIYLNRKSTDGDVVAGEPPNGPQDLPPMKPDHSDDVRAPRQPW